MKLKKLISCEATKANSITNKKRNPFIFNYYLFMYIELVFDIKYLMNLLNIIKGKNLLYS